MATVFVHHGPYESITNQSSPGCRFLKALLPALDSLSPADHSISQFVRPTTQFFSNGISLGTAETVKTMLIERAQKLESFHHNVMEIRDIEKDDGRRTVMYESVSVTTFKKDPERKAIEVFEFNIVELEPMDGGVEGLVASELRVYMDPKPIMQRVSELQG